MNRGELRAAVLDRCGVPPSGDGMLDATRVNLCIQAALSDLSNEAQWPWLMTSAALTFTGTTAPFPADLVTVREMSVNDRRARHVDLTEFMDDKANGYRCVWTTIGTNVEVSPTPITALVSPRLYYYRDEPELSVDTQSPLCPTQYHRTVVARAAYHAEVRRTRPDAARLNDAEWAEGVRQMKGRELRANTKRTIRSAPLTRFWAEW